MEPKKPESPKSDEDIELAPQDDGEISPKPAGSWEEETKRADKVADLVYLAQKIKAQAKTKEDYDKLAELYRKIEKLYEPESKKELEPALAEQYKNQVEILIKSGLVSALAVIESSGEGLVADGMDGKFYPLPTEEAIAEKIEKNKEFIEKKRKQGFTKLLLVPFGLPLPSLIEAYSGVISKHDFNDNIFGIPKNPGEPRQSLEVNANEPVLKSERYDQADITGQLVYQPKEFSKNHQGKNKLDIIGEQGGWRILLVEDVPNIPEKITAAGTKGGRIEIDRRGGSVLEYIKQGQTIPSPAEYLEAIQQNPNYQGEQGFTPEDWLMYAITHLEETNQVIDDIDNGGSATYLMGAYFPGENYLPSAEWNRRDSQAFLAINPPDRRDLKEGIRTAVEIK